MPVETIEEVVMPPANPGQLSTLAHILEEPVPPVLRGADGTETILPTEVYSVLVDVVTAMSKGQAISLAPKNQRLTTREAADLLGVSRPTLVHLLEERRIPYEQPSRHRYVMLADLLAYRESRRHKRRTALAELTRDAAELGLYDDPESTDVVARAVKQSRKEIQDSDMK